MHRAVFAAVPFLVAAASVVGCTSAPTGLFENVAERDGQPRFVSYSGDRLWYLLDTMGSGVAVGDFDADGRPDIFWLSGFAVTESFREEALEHGDRLWHNEGDGRFTDVTEAAGLVDPGWSNGACFIDFDADGDLDIFVARYGANRLWRNGGDGTFVDVAAEVGVADPGGFGAGAAWLDYDADGDLDLYVTNYCHYDAAALAGKVQWFTDGVRQFPAYYEPQDNALFRNEGDGTFVDVTAETGTEGTGHSLTPLAFDYDDDGDVDIFVANDIGYNNMLQNEGDGTFVDVSFESGLAGNEDAQFEACMGAAVADYDGDGRLDIIVTNFEREQNTLYRNEGNGLFVDVTVSAGLRNQAVVDAVGWGVGLHDLDCDGDLDAVFVNGHIVTTMILWYMGQRDQEDDPSVGETDVVPQMSPESFQGDAEQPKRLFLGKGDGTFEDVTERVGGGFDDERMGRGAAFADLDGDGRIDILVSNKNDDAEVWLNRMPVAGSFVTLDLRAPAPNTFAVGAVVTIEAGGKKHTRLADTSASYLSSNDRIIHVGLGPLGEGEAKVDRIVVRWPGGEREELGPLEADARHVITKGAGRPIEDEDEDTRK